MIFQQCKSPDGLSCFVKPYSERMWFCWDVEERAGEMPKRGSDEPWRDSCSLLLISTPQAGQELPSALCRADPLNCCIPILRPHELTGSPSLPVSIYLISQKSFREEGMFVQTKWGPCPWLALLNTRITKRNIMCLNPFRPLKGKVKKKTKHRNQSDFIF